MSLKLAENIGNAARVARTHAGLCRLAEVLNASMDALVGRAPRAPDSHG